MLIQVGTQERFLTDAPTAAGTTTKDGSIDSDSLLVTLWVDSVTSGTLSLTVYTLTDEDKVKDIINFPTVSAPSTELLLRKAAISLQRFRIVATYTGGCEYEVYVRAISSGGESSARILGSSNWRVSQVTVGVTPQVLIASSLEDRSGVLVKNWSATANVFIAESGASSTPGVGYPLAPKDALALDIAAGAAVYGVSDVPGADLRIVEAGA